MKRILLYIMAVLMALSLAACGMFGNTASEKDLYKAGLELISVMDEMLQSDEYAEIIGIRVNKDVIESVNTKDYSSPTAVYSISSPEVNDLLQQFGNYKVEDWNNLSDNLKVQIENKVSFSSVISSLNGRKGADEISFAALYTATDRKDNIKPEKPISYLYIFEKGTPIAVSFTEDGYLYGQFVFLEKTDSLSDIKSLFDAYKCDISEIEFAQ